tara:strand:+ start:41 stop:241 length:201 start_codon:yes stop_codon:yes gene_type:complete
MIRIFKMNFENGEIVRVKILRWNSSWEEGVYIGKDDAFHIVRVNDEFVNDHKYQEFNDWEIEKGEK